MAKKGSNRSTGSNVEITFFKNNLIMPTDDIDSLEITNNDNLLNYRPLGAVVTTSDIDYGNFTLELKTGKTGSNSMRLANLVEAEHLKGNESPKWDILVTIRSKDGVGLESYTYVNCVLQFKSVSANEAGQPITESITATAEKRIPNSLIPQKDIF